MDIKKANEAMRAAYHAAGYTCDDIVMAIVDHGMKPVGRIKDKVTGDAKDVDGHGTAMAGIANEWCPGAELRSYRLTLGNINGIITQLDTVLADALKMPDKQFVVNMSISLQYKFDTSAKEELRQAIQRLLDHNIPVFCSAGNDGNEPLYKYPATLEEPTCITGANNDGTHADISCFLNAADFAEECVKVKTIDLNGKEIEVNGTSASSIIAACKGALLLHAYRKQTGKRMTEPELYQRMKADARKLSTDSFSPYFGWGFVDIGTPNAVETPTEPTEPETPQPNPEALATSTAQQFYNKARQCVGGLYVWGGQGHKATEAWLRSKAKADPEYFDGGRLEMMLARVKADPALRAWDCSGLVNWALAQIGAVKAGFDTTAQGLYANYCTKLSAPELPGDLMFRYSGGKMVHVGIYAPGACVEAAGGAYGVVESKGLTGADHTAKSYVNGKTYQLPDWTHYGRLKGFAAAAPDPVPDPTPEPVSGEKRAVICTGASVNLRGGPGTEHSVVITAHAGDMFIALPAANGWRQISGFVGNEPVAGYMSDKYLKEA